MTQMRVVALVAATTLMVCLAAVSAALANGGAAWGGNEGGRLGIATSGKVTVPTTVFGLSGVKALAAGGNHSLALLTNGHVEAWGNNEDGQLGNGTHTSSNVPVAVSGLSEVVEVAAGWEFSLALLASGKVMAWGANNFGELGNGGSEGSDVPVEVSELEHVKAISAGRAELFDYGLALLENGTVKAWGANEYGTLGDGSEKEISRTPVEVSGLEEVVSISAGPLHGLAALSNGTVKAWGLNDEGQIGNGTTTGPDNCDFGFKCWRTPTTALELSEAVAVTAGYDFSTALLSGGKVATWGASLRLGGREGPTNRPETLSTVSGVTQISSGETHTLALLPSGKVEEWGENEMGQLGNGGTGFGHSAWVPTLLPELTGVEGVSAGTEYSLSWGSPGPLVTGLKPNEGTSHGGTEVEIKGTELSGLKAVDFSSLAATSFTGSSSTVAHAVSPAKRPSTAQVTVQGTNGIWSPPDAPSSYTYVPVGELQFGRCKEVGGGKGSFKTANCTEELLGGKFAWTAGVAKGSFTIADGTEKLGKPKAITLASKSSTLSCENATGSGSYSGLEDVTGIVVHFTGCTLGASKCSSVGAAEGEIATSTLAGGLGWREKTGNLVGLDLGASGEEAFVLEATCGASTVKVRGSAIAPLTPVNKMSSSFTLKFKASKGVQSPESFEGEAKEVFEVSTGGEYEQAALTFEANLNNEEELEANTTI